MPKLIGRVAALFILLSVLAWPAAVQAKWYRAETKHFIFYSSGTLSQLEDFAIETEKFDAMLRRRFNIPEGEITNRLTIYVLPNGKQVGELAGRNVAGFYTSHLEGSFAVSNREKPVGQLGQTGTEVLFHEYTHHFFARHLPVAYPQWLTEGFAEYYSTVEFERDGSYTVGKVVGGRAYGLVRGQEFPIRKVLFEGLHDELDREQGDIFYGRSWLLVHKLMSSNEGREQLANYIGDFNSTMTPEQAAEKNFGDLDALDKELEKLVRVSIPMFKYSLPVDFDAGFSARELDKADGELIGLQLERRAGSKPLETRDALRALAAENPGRADILNELAHAEFRLWQEAQTDEEEAAALAAAETAADAALAIDPKHVRANVLKAKLMGERLSGDATADDIKTIRRHLVTANRADPLDPLPLYEYFRSFPDFGEVPPDIAIAGLEQSYTAAPEISQFRVDLAYAYANQGDFAVARQLLRYLAYNPHAADYGQRLLSQIDEMEIGWQRNERLREEYERDMAGDEAEAAALD